MKVMVTCPPMLGAIDEFKPKFAQHKVELVAPKVVQTLSEEELIQLLPQMDGWIIGDDPATEKVFSAGVAGRLKAAVKWGVGIDNVDFAAAKRLGIPITNTPNMFGSEVADMAIAYLIGLARQTHQVHMGVLNNQWIKPAGISISGRKVGIVGFGDIGKQVAKRCLALGLEVHLYDPYATRSVEDLKNYQFHTWPNNLHKFDFLVLTAALNNQTHQIVNKESIVKMKNQVRIINVSRGGLINEKDLVQALVSKKVHSVGLDVFEDEPLAPDNPLRNFELNIFGTHNGSNTVDAVRRASYQAINSLFSYLNII